MSGDESPTVYGGTEETGDDFIDSFQLPVRFTDSQVEHELRTTDIRSRTRNAVHVQQWHRTCEIGRGGFGTVFLETEKSGAVRAVKEVPKQSGRHRTIDYLKEVLAMAHFRKEEALFVTLEGWYQDASHIFIAMEYFEKGDLAECVTVPLPENEVQSISHQLLEALKFMHQKKFTHRDIKPSNIFVVNNAPNWWIKVGDFGVAKRVRDDATSLHTSIETVWTAPEVVGFIDLEDSASCYTSAVDIWSAGCLVYWLLTHELPLPRRRLMAYCRGKVPLPTADLESHHCSPQAIDFLQKLLRAEPGTRLLASEAFSHGWPQLNKTQESVSSTLGPSKMRESIVENHHRADEGHKKNSHSRVSMTDKIEALKQADYPNLDRTGYVSPSQQIFDSSNSHVPSTEVKSNVPRKSTRNQIAKEAVKQLNSLGPSRYRAEKKVTHPPPPAYQTRTEVRKDSVLAVKVAYILHIEIVSVSGLTPRIPIFSPLFHSDFPKFKVYARLDLLDESYSSVIKRTPRTTSRQYTENVSWKEDFHIPDRLEIWKTPRIHNRSLLISIHLEDFGESLLADCFYPLSLQHYLQYGFDELVKFDMVSADPCLKNVEIMLRIQNSGTNAHPTWEICEDNEKQTYYLNRNAKTTTWCHPLANTKVFDRGPLPPGWEMAVNEFRDVYFRDNNTSRITWTDPREDKEGSYFDLPVRVPLE